MLSLLPYLFIGASAGVTLAVMLDKMEATATTTLVVLTLACFTLASLAIVP